MSKDMENKNIIKLRNHHITKGKSTDRRPIYPITTVEAIEGLEDKLVEMEGGLKYSTTASKFTSYVTNDETQETPTLVAYANTYILEPNVYYNLGDILETVQPGSGGRELKSGNDDTSDIPVVPFGDDKIRFFLKDCGKNPNFLEGGEGYIREYYVEFFYSLGAGEIIFTELPDLSNPSGTSPILTPITLTSNCTPGHRLLMHIVGKDVFIYEISSDFPGPGNYSGERGTTR